MTGSNNSDERNHPDHHQHHKLNLHHDRKKHHTKTLPHPPSPDDTVVDPEYNVFRDSLLRYLGYANEVGESFRYQFPRLVKPSYVVAFGYCLADAVTSGYQAYNNETLEMNNEKNAMNGSNSGTTTNTATTTETATNDTRMFDATVACTDTLLWQSMASVAIPGLVIHQIVKWSRVGIQKMMISQTTKQPTFIMTWAPTMLGLASIPLIIKPIDYFVDELMDHTFRRIVSISDDNDNGVSGVSSNDRK